MKTKNRTIITKNLKILSFVLWFYVFSFSLMVCLPSSVGWAVSSKITRHSSGADLLKGETKDIVVSSRGTIQLGRAAEVLVEEFEDVWSINSIIVSGGTVFVGTSPNGGIYEYSLGKVREIYQAKSEKKQSAEQESGNESSDADEPNDANEPGGLKGDKKRSGSPVEAEQYLANEHIFAMATDIAGRVLVGISGDRCALCRLEAGQMKTVFEPNDAKYIFAIDTDDSGNIYLGTGPEGKVYRLDAFGKESQLVYDSSDKNILSLTIGRDGFVYAGSDSRGLIYKINPRTETVVVLYDSDQPEIAALLFAEDGELYAAATSAKVVQAETKFAQQLPLAGRPELKLQEEKGYAEDDGALKLKIPNTKEQTDDEKSEGKIPPRKPSKPPRASYIYKVTSDGYVTDVFSETAVFFAMAEQDGKLLIGTGNSGQLFTIDPAAEEEAVVYEDKQTSQITAVVVSGDDVYLGTANPAKLIKLSKRFAAEGAYTSELIDAGQPTKWGKLQIEADIPQECEVMVSSRSGNVKDVNDPTFSDWTELVEVTGPVQLGCPLGRFCQYKLVLQSEDGQKSPLVREIAVANTVPNLAPKVESVSVSKITSASKEGLFKISYKAEDDNEDKLIYKIDFRKIGRTNWIELKDEIEKDSFEWDGKTIEDGRYEVRVTASDERSNTITTKLTGGRISEPVVVDNTGPIIIEHQVTKAGTEVTLKLKVSDQLSAIDKVEYTVDSNAEWKGAMPNDLVYDTREENFDITIKDLAVGEHVLTIKATDAVGNTTYKTFDITVNAGS